jgi:thiol-disulfide isomerase/thioredoxin
MSRIILLGADWCPVTQAAKKLFDELKDDVGFDYEYVDIESDKGKRLVDKFSVTDVPKAIAGDKIIFHGMPPKDKLIRFIKGKN